MALEKIKHVTGKAVPVPGDDIDTDRIIPASYMKCVTFDGLGEHLFKDARFESDGTPKPHPLNETKYKDATILISGNNFGCGSSREHAPQAIHKAGFRGIIAEGFAEIFFGNATTLGIPCVSVAHKDRMELAKLIEETPDTEVVIDLKEQKICAGKKQWPFELRESARQSLLEGRWDPIAELMEGLPEVEQLAQKIAN